MTDNRQRIHRVLKGYSPPPPPHFSFFFFSGLAVVHLLISISVHWLSNHKRTILVLLLRQYGENYLEKRDGRYRLFMERDQSMSGGGVTSARKAAIFPTMLLTLPSEAPLREVLANHKSHAHWPFLAKKIIYSCIVMT